MKTELLEEYIFANIILAEARVSRRIRQNKMEAEGVNEEQVNRTPLLPEDLRRAIEVFDEIRHEVAVILKEFPVEQHE